MRRTAILYTALMWAIALVGVCLVATVARGDIQVKPQYDEHEPIVATVSITDVPEGAKLRGSFAVSDGTYLPAGENIYHVWAPQGKHILTAQGVWVLTQEVDVGGQKIQALVDFGQFRYEREFTVGEVPGPDPPVPPGERRAVIWEETEDRTPQQGNLFLQLRKEFPDETLQIQDVTDLPPSLRSLESQRPPNLPLPVLMVVVRQTDKTDKVVRTVALPSSVAGVKVEVAK